MPEENPNRPPRRPDGAHERPRRPSKKPSLEGMQVVLVQSISCIVVVLLVLGQFGSVGLAGNSYPGPLYLLAASLAGWMLVYEGAHLLARVPAVSGAFSALGRATMPIVILHFLAFKPVTWLGLLATGGESYLLAAFPIYFTSGAWWVAYTAAGLALPLLAYAVWVRLKKAVRRG